MTAEPERYLSDREVGKLFCVHAGTVWRWCKERGLPKPIKIGGATRWRQSEVLAWAEAQAKRGAA
jgi:predicted DNA-binding transcriptional regulator AlpA